VYQLDSGLHRLLPELFQAHALVVIPSTLLLHHLRQISDVAALLEHPLGLENLAYSPPPYPSAYLVSHPPTHGISHHFLGLSSSFADQVASPCRLNAGGLSHLLGVL
jgi:hypothetical protein